MQHAQGLQGNSALMIMLSAGNFRRRAQTATGLDALGAELHGTAHVHLFMAQAEGMRLSSWLAMFLAKPT